MASSNFEFYSQSIISPEGPQSATTSHRATTEFDLWAVTESEDLQETPGDEDCDELFVGEDLAGRADRANDMKMPPLPFPSFLINPQDGQFTPYFDRTPAGSLTDETPDSMGLSFPSPHSSPMTATTALRSRAASLALQKLMDSQAQMLLDLSTAWKRKYPEHSSERLANPSVSSATPVRAQVIRLDSQFTRKTRSTVWRASHSVTGRTDRLSLNEDDSSRAVDVEKWKQEAVEHKAKLESIRSWVSRLSFADQSLEVDPDLEDVDDFFK